MTWGATITTSASRTAQPRRGHGQAIGHDRPRRPAPASPRVGHMARAIGTGTCPALIDQAVIMAHHLSRHQAAFYANSECERLPAHLREGGQ